MKWNNIKRSDLRCVQNSTIRLSSFTNGKSVVYGRLGLEVDPGIFEGVTVLWQQFGER